MGRPQSPVLSRQFSLLCIYLESNNECQFSLKDREDIVVEISGSDIDYTDYYLKTKLIDFLKTDWLYIAYLEIKVFYVCPKLVSRFLNFDTKTESKLQRKNVKE